MLLMLLLLQVLLRTRSTAGATAKADGAGAGVLVSTLQILPPQGPMNLALLGANWEGVVFGWSYRNSTCPRDCSLASWVSVSDPLLSQKLVAALRALRVRSLRFPGGGPSNQYNWQNASFVPPNLCNDNQPCPPGGYWGAQRTANTLLGEHRRQLSWQRFVALLDVIGARGVWSLDIVQQTPGQAADVLSQLQAALPHHQPLSVELGNEIYGPPTGMCAGAAKCMFPTAGSYLDYVKPILAARLGGSQLSVTVPPCPAVYSNNNCWGGNKTWLAGFYRNVSAACLLRAGSRSTQCPWQQVTAHHYRPRVSVIDCTPYNNCSYRRSLSSDVTPIEAGLHEEQLQQGAAVTNLTFAAAMVAYPSVTLHSATKNWARDFPGLKLLVSEYNADYASTWKGALGQGGEWMKAVANGGAHAIHWAAGVLAGVNSNGIISGINYHSLQGSGGPSASPGFGILDWNTQGDTVKANAVAQLMSHISAIANNSMMHSVLPGEAMLHVEGVPGGLVIDNVANLKALQSAAFSAADGSLTVVLINRGTADVNVSIDVGPSGLYLGAPSCVPPAGLSTAVTSYSALDAGGWAEFDPVTQTAVPWPGPMAPARSDVKLAKVSATVLGGLVAPSLSLVVASIAACDTESDRETSSKTDDGAAGALSSSSKLPRPAASSQQPQPPPKPTPCTQCIANAGLQLSSKANSHAWWCTKYKCCYHNTSAPRGWQPYTWNNSTFGWGPPPAEQCKSNAGDKSLRITGGSGVWTTSLNASAAPRDGNWQDGRTAVVSVWANYCAHNVRAGAELVAYVGGVHNFSSLPGWGASSDGIIGWATFRVPNASSTSPRRVYFGDIRLPATDAQTNTKITLNLRLDDGTATAADEPPTTVFFTDVEVLAVTPPTSIGMSQPLQKMGGVRLWGDHASHKVWPSETAPTNSRGVGGTTLLTNSVMKGGTAAVQLIFRRSTVVESQRVNNHLKNHACAVALSTACPLLRQGTTSAQIQCDSCAGQHQEALKHAQCTSEQVQQWCAASPPSFCSLKWDNALITAALVMNVNMSRVSGTYGRRGPTPDPLLPLMSGTVFQFPSDTTQPVLLKVAVPETSAAGVQTNAIYVRCGAAAADPITISLKTNVWDLTLPAKPSVQTHSNVWLPKVLALGPHDRAWHANAVAKALYSTIFASRAQAFFNFKSCNPLCDVSFKKDGSLTAAPNTTCFAQMVDYVAKHSPLGKAQFFSLPNTWLGGDHAFASSWEGITIFEPGDTLTAEFKTGFGAVVRSYLQVLQARGIPPDSREIKLVDEPDWGKPGALAQCLSLFRFVKTICAEFGGCCIRTSGTLPIPPPVVSLLGSHDIWDVHSDFFTHEAAAVAGAKGLRLTVYDNSADLIDQPATRARAFVWQQFVERSQLIGSLSWWSDTDYAGGSGPGVRMISPWNSDGVVSKRVVNGDGALFYDSWSAPNITQPTLSSQSFEVCSSIRWENFAQGLQDYELLKLASDAEKRLRATSSSLRSSSGLNVSQLARLVTSRFSHTQPAYDQPFTVDCTMIEWVREQLAQLAQS